MEVSQSSDVLPVHCSRTSFFANLTEASRFVGSPFDTSREMTTENVHQPPPKIAKSKAFLSRTLSQLSTIDGCFVGEFQHESVFLVGIYLRECEQKATPEVFEPRIACRMDRQDGRTISANTGIENRLVIGCEPSL